MKIKHLVGVLALTVVILVVGCGGGTLGLQNVNSTQVYTTGGYTIDALKIKTPAANPSTPTTP